MKPGENEKEERQGYIDTERRNPSEKDKKERQMKRVRENIPEIDLLGSGISGPLLRSRLPAATTLLFYYYYHRHSCSAKTDGKRIEPRISLPVFQKKIRGRKRS